MLNRASAAKAGIAFRALRFGNYGTQVVIVDARDEDLLCALGVSVKTTRFKFVVQHPKDPMKRIGLANAVAERHVARPSPSYNCVAFRNGSAIDCRASNLYWATRAQLMRKGNGTWRMNNAKQPARRVDDLTNI